VQFRVDFGGECTEMELPGELAGIEISHRRRLNFGRIDFRYGDGFLAGFNNDVAQGFAFFFKVALKVGPRAVILDPASG
jgi:hypothetical protein